MTERNELMLAALTSAALPSVVVAGVFPGATHIGGVDQAQVRDVTGKMYDVYATDDEKGRAKLAARVKAAKALADAREPGGLGFAFDRVLAFVPGDDPKGPTGRTAVMVAMHQEGRERDLNLLTLDDCSSMGTAIGAIHRLNPMFIAKARYPIFATAQIKAQLVAWIARLKHAGHVPPEITSSWSKILETEGLWSFGTCLVHGGFEDGDVRFSGSTITAINNWQNMQVNDPARDLAWIFSKLDEDHRNAVLTAYGRMMGNRLDDLIMLRANLWVQMEQVGEFIQALNKADTQGIIRFKAQVDRLAHQLGVTSRAVDDSNAAAKAARRANAAGAGASPDPDDTADNPPSTITVGTLLKDGERRRAAAKAAQEAARANQEPDDETAESDRTGSADIAAAGRIAVPTGNDDTMDAPIKAPEMEIPPSFPVKGVRGKSSPAAGTADADAGTGATGSTGSTKPQPAGAYANMPAPSSSETITLDSLDEDDDTDEHDVKEAAAPVEDAPSLSDIPSFPVAAAVAHGGFGADRPLGPGESGGAFHSPRGGHPNNAATIVIPLLEREERALRDARAGLDVGAAAPDASDDTADGDDTADSKPIVAVEAAPEEPRNFDETPGDGTAGAESGESAGGDESAAGATSDTSDTSDGPDPSDDESDDTADTPVAASDDADAGGDDTGESTTTPKA